MTIYETVLQMLITAAENMVNVEAITLSAAHWDFLMVALVDKGMTGYPRIGTGHRQLQFMGPRGYVTIYRGEE